MELSFTGPVIEWRGPAPYLFVGVPDGRGRRDRGGLGRDHLRVGDDPGDRHHRGDQLVHRPVAHATACTSSRSRSGSAGPRASTSTTSSPSGSPWTSEAYAEPVRPTLYEYAGGDAALLRLAQAHHERCVADPELNHPFSKDDLNPEHVRAAGGVLGRGASVGRRGSPAGWATSRRCWTCTPTTGRWTTSGAASWPASTRPPTTPGCPTTPSSGRCCTTTWTWAVADVLVYAPMGSQVPDGVRMPHWSWDGLVE